MYDTGDFTWAFSVMSRYYIIIVIDSGLWTCSSAHIQLTAGWKTKAPFKSLDNNALLTRQYNIFGVALVEKILPNYYI